MTRRPRAPLAVALAVTALLAACTGPAEPRATSGTSEAPGAKPSASTDARLTPTDPDGLRAAGTAVPVGDVTLAVWPPLPEAPGAPDEDGAVVLTAPLPVSDGGTGSVVPVLTVVPPAGTTVEELEDGSALVRDGDGRAVAAVTAPVLDGVATGSGLRVQVDADGGGTLAWSVVVPVRTDGSVEPLPGGTVTATLAATAVRGATWSDRDDEGGRSLAVVPATWARTGGRAGEEAVWSQLVAQVPEAGTPAMHDQLTCHTIGAPDKASWNLEPWRPDVGLLQTLAALCNPE
ncbi:DUF2599 domain-containing protein [Cellulomonas endometrii]|uniref:DUF2599 domain-containing protein n=1 Tax=Cellulomonas endometrii TaxID=3036301 RepID=UPI0024AE22F9|nr:DUF2599 domain-containing protein [Cellulomonas endometrii]